MKKIILALSLVILPAAVLFPGTGGILPESLSKGKSASGSVWIMLGGRATFNNTWLLNKNEMNNENQKYLASFGGNGGLMLGLHLSEMFAVNGEFLFSSYSQKMKSAVDSFAWDAKTNLTYFDIPVLLHFDFNNFKFLELGVQFGLLNGARHTFNSDFFTAENEDVKKNYTGNTSIVFGWGTGVWGSGGFLLSGGIRLTYGISDILSEEGGRGDNYLSPEGLKSYQPTNTATVGFHLNLDFDLGWFTKSSCGRNYKFTLFSH